MKPGVKSTEFWSWVATIGISTVTFIRVLTLVPADPWVELAVYACKSLIDVAVTAFYMWARAHVKAEHIRGETALKIAQLNADQLMLPRQ